MSDYSPFRALAGRPHRIPSHTATTLPSGDSPRMVPRLPSVQTQSCHSTPRPPSRPPWPHDASPRPPPKAPSPPCFTAAASCVLFLASVAGAFLAPWSPFAVDSLLNWLLPSSSLSPIPPALLLLLLCNAALPFPAMLLHSCLLPHTTSATPPVPSPCSCCFCPSHLMCLRCRTCSTCCSCPSPSSTSLNLFSFLSALPLSAILIGNFSLLICLPSFLSSPESPHPVPFLPFLPFPSPPFPTLALLILAIQDSTILFCLLILALTLSLSCGPCTLTRTQTHRSTAPGGSRNLCCGASDMLGPIQVPPDLASLPGFKARQQHCQEEWQRLQLQPLLHGGAEAYGFWRALWAWEKQHQSSNEDSMGTPHPHSGLTDDWTGRDLSTALLRQHQQHQGQDQILGTVEEESISGLMRQRWFSSGSSSGDEECSRASIHGGSSAPCCWHLASAAASAATVGPARVLDMDAVLRTKSHELPNSRGRLDANADSVGLRKELAALKMEAQVLRQENDKYVAETTRLRSVLNEWSVHSARLERALMVAHKKPLHVVNNDAGSKSTQKQIE